MASFWTPWAEIWSIVWTYKISLVPVLATYILFDLPTIVRKLTGIAYVPIYFLIFPLGHSDRLYAEYLNEDDMYGVGEAMSSDDKRRLRQKIQSTAIFSMVFASVIAPWLCGFASAFYLQPQQFKEFLAFLFIIKIYLIVTAVWRLRNESRAASNSTAFLSIVAVYLVYLIFVWHGLNKSFNWTSTHLNSTGIGGLAAALLDYAYTDLIINVGVVAALTWAFNIKLTDPANITKSDRYIDDPDSPAEPAPSNR